LVPTRSESLFFKGVECIEQERADSKIQFSNALKALKLMLGEDLLLRLGGWLHNAALEYCEKHPIILQKHRISELLIDYAHRALHGGTQLTLRNLRQKY